MKPKCCKTKIAKKIRQTAELLKVIAEENRLKILCLLKDGERCVCDIWQDLGIPQNLASHHLNVLKTKGLINSRKEGFWVFYSINRKGIKLLKTLLTNFFQTYERK